MQLDLLIKMARDYRKDYMRLSDVPHGESHFLSVEVGVTKDESGNRILATQNGHTHFGFSFRTWAYGYASVEAGGIAFGKPVMSRSQQVILWIRDENGKFVVDTDTSREGSENVNGLTVLDITAEQAARVAAKFTARARHSEPENDDRTNDSNVESYKQYQQDKRKARMSA